MNYDDVRYTYENSAREKEDILVFDFKRLLTY